MATEGPFQVEANTIGLWLLNGANIGVAGVDESTSGYDLELTQGSPTYGVDGYGKAVHTDGVDEGIEFHDGSDSSVHSPSTSLSVDPVTVEVVCYVHVWEPNAVGGICGTAKYNANDRFGWGVYTQNYGTPPDHVIFMVNDGSVAWTTDYAFTMASEDWLNQWIYICGRFDSANSDSSGTYGYINCGRLETDTNTSAGTTNGFTSGSTMDTRTAAFHVGIYLDDFPARSMDGVVSTVHVISEFKTDAWVESRYDAVVAWATGGGGSRRGAILNGVGRGVGRGLHKDSECGLIEPTLRETYIINGGN